MSEFIESFHLRHSNRDEAKTLLTTIGVRGITYKETNGWTTVLPLGENSQVSNISSNYRGVVLHYLYSEDHAWMINLLSNGELISSYVCAWTPVYFVQDDLLDIEAFYPYLLTPDSQSEFKMIFVMDDFEDIFDVNPAFRFAELLGIEHYQWLEDKDISKCGAEIVRDQTDSPNDITDDNNILPGIGVGFSNSRSLQR